MSSILSCFLEVFVRWRGHRHSFGQAVGVMGVLNGEWAFNFDWILWIQCFTVAVVFCGHGVAELFLRWCWLLSLDVLLIGSIIAAGIFWDGSACLGFLRSRLAALFGSICRGLLVVWAHGFILFWGVSGGSWRRVAKWVRRMTLGIWLLLCRCLAYWRAGLGSSGVRMVVRWLALLSSAEMCFPKESFWSYIAPRYLALVVYGMVWLTSVSDA